ARHPGQRFIAGDTRGGVTEGSHENQRPAETGNLPIAVPVVDIVDEVGGWSQVSGIGTDAEIKLLLPSEGGIHDKPAREALGHLGLQGIVPGISEWRPKEAWDTEKLWNRPQRLVESLGGREARIDIVRVGEPGETGDYRRRIDSLGEQPAIYRVGDV